MQCVRQTKKTLFSVTQRPIYIVARIWFPFFVVDDVASYLLLFENVPSHNVVKTGAKMFQSKRIRQSEIFHLN
jgi:hypothetical protein